MSEQKTEKHANVNITSFHKYKTYFNADSVEWCPHENFKNIFVCANYQLNKGISGDGSRVGKLLLFSLEADGLHLKQDLNTFAVLDQKWCFTLIEGEILLGVVNSSSQVLIFKLDQINLKLEPYTTYDFCKEDNTDLLILSMDWSIRKINSTEPLIVCTDTSGKVHVLKLCKNELVLELSLKSHEFEVWIGGFYYWDPNIFFSGGDDSLFYQYDLRIGQSVAKNRKHEAGVTSIHSNPAKEYTIVTGSYDEYVRLWDIRKLKDSLITKKASGPVWRLKWDPFTNDHILAACMLGGLNVFKYDGKELNLTNAFYEHTDIVYGIDWSFIDKTDTKYVQEDCCIIASCSFYDNLLYVSKCFL